MRQQVGIPNHLIQQAKESLGDRAMDIIAAGAGLHKYNPRQKEACCPFHKDDTPSFKWDSKHYRFHCFGCDGSLDIIDHYRENEGLVFIDAVKKLFEETGTSYDFDRFSKEDRDKYSEDQKRKNAIVSARTKAADLYHENLLKNNHIYNYIINEWGFTPETIAKLKIGYCSNGWAKEILKETSFTEQELLDADIFRKARDKEVVYETFMGRIVFPYFDNLRKVIAFNGRYYIDDSAKATEKELEMLKNRKYLRTKGENKHLYNGRILANEDTIVITEGEKDCITLLQAGFKAVGTGGGLDPGQAKVISQYKNISTIYIAFDNDDDISKGESKALKAAMLLEESFTDVRIVFLPDLIKDEVKIKVDINDFYLTDKETFKNRFLDLQSTAVDTIQYEILKLKDMGFNDRFNKINQIAVNVASRPMPQQIMYMNYIIDKADIGLSKSDIRDIFKDAEKAVKKEEIKVEPVANQNASPGTDFFNFTDTGNAERFVKKYGDIIKYVDEWKSWLIWNGRYWELDKTKKIERLAKETVRSMYTEASKIVDDQRRAQLVKHAIKSESKKSRQDMIELAKAENGVIRPINEYDRNIWLLNCNNGTIDLRTGELRPHNKDDLITKQIPINYNPKAKCEQWMKFIKEIMDHDMELVEFIQRAVGYSLTGSIKEQVMFILLGVGSNGKSKLIETIRALLGDDYSRNVQPQTLMTKDRVSSGASGDVARLKGARFVTSVENDEGTKMDEGLIKQLTGDDRITARFLYGNEFEFEPQLKIWLATNHKPAIKGTDDGIWRRIRLIPFKVTFTKEKGNRDDDLPQKLLAEIEGILNWAIEGCLKWQKEGLKEPNQVMEATKEYRNRMDVIAAFLDECCVIGKGVQVTVKQLYDEYVSWCLENGEKALKKNDFRDRLLDKNIEPPQRGTGNKHFWQGIGLLDISHTKEVEGQKSNRPSRIIV